MSYSISTLLTRNLPDVFCENDPTRQRAAIDEIFTEDCVFHEPRGRLRSYLGSINSGHFPIDARGGHARPIPRRMFWSMGPSEVNTGNRSRQRSRRSAVRV